MIISFLGKPNYYAFEKNDSQEYEEKKKERKNWKTAGVIIFHKCFRN